MLLYFLPCKYKWVWCAFMVNSQGCGCFTYMFILIFLLQLCQRKSNRSLTKTSICKIINVTYACQCIHEHRKELMWLSHEGLSIRVREVSDDVEIIFWIVKLSQKATWKFRALIILVSEISWVQHEF